MQKKLIIPLSICVLILACLGVFAISQYQNKDIDTNNSATGIAFYPPEQHPYIYVNDEYIEYVKANKESDMYKEAYTYQLSLAKKELPEQPEAGNVNMAISNQLKARAFMYMMGEFDEKHAQDTIQYTIEYLENANTTKTGNIDIYKDFGENGIMTGAFVYDWCYAACTDEQKEQLASAVKAMIYDERQPCRPDNIDTWSEIANKAVGLPVVYNSIACSAFYDVYPEMYETMMSKIQGDMAEIVKIHGEAGAFTDGSNSYLRLWYSYYVQTLFARWGCDIKSVYGDQSLHGNRLLYGILPFGNVIKTGDDYENKTFVWGEPRTNTEYLMNSIGILQALYEEPYLKHIYARDNYSSNDLLSLLTKRSDQEAEVPDDLPLAHESLSPRSEIIHKTSWQEGLDSPQVTAYLNMNNRRTGDHDHAESGSFQLYYKGPLSIANGIYVASAWGGDHWKNYLSRTVSKNSMLVYDPEEEFYFGDHHEAVNEGGQLMVNQAGGETVLVIDQLEDYMAEENLRTTTEASYIGPNEITPAFSYLKGDLTKQYASNKMAGYKRSMVFMDTFNETYPGVLIVFDRIQSTKAEYEKTWLLQAVAEPHISGNKITIDNSETEETANGKLVNQVLYPENVEITAVGGIGKFVSAGQEYPAEAAGTKFYQSGWRAEVKNTELKADDTFLNAMFVADADTTAPDLEMIKVEDDLFMGVVTLDRQVMFSKTGELIDKKFSVEIQDNNAGGDMLILLTDMKPGKWKVSGNGVDLILESKESDNAFAFQGKAGEYKISPVGSGKKVTEIAWPQAEKEEIGDFAVKVGYMYQYMRQPNKLVDGVAYVPESFISNSLAYTYKKGTEGILVTVSNGNTISFKAGSKEYMVLAGKTLESKTMEHEPFVDENGVFYISLEGSVATDMGLSKVKYNSAAKALHIEFAEELEIGTAELAGVDNSKVIMPVSITVSTHDGNEPKNLIDRNLDTRWSSIQGDGEWACFYLGDKAVEISSVQIAWYNGDKRHWKFDIEISDDGENFTPVLSNMKSEGKSKDVETYPLPEGTKAKYVRYVGHGEEVTATWYNSVTEFIVNGK